MNHQTAKQLVDTFGLTPAESLALRAVSWHETNYGQGWKTAAQRAANNMGAITTSRRAADGGCIPPDFQHGDSRREGAGGEGGAVVQYVTCFAGRATPLEGFALLKATLYDSKVQSDDKTFTRGPAMHAAAAAGLPEVARVMRETRYYLGTAKTKPEQIAAYQGALERSAQLIVQNTGEPWPWSSSSAGGSGGTGSSPPATSPETPDSKARTASIIAFVLGMVPIIAKALKGVKRL